jgi:hypothetical protein
MGNVKGEALTDRIKEWRSNYEAGKEEEEAAAKAKREARMAEIRAKVAAIQQRPKR